jgi:hypothetical protein
MIKIQTPPLLATILVVTNANIKELQIRGLLSMKMIQK